MTDINLSALDVTVFGGPSTVDVDVDFGPPGVRGSRINAVIADPRLVSTPKPSDALIGDILLNVSPSKSDYLMLYQKIGSGSEDWQEIVELYPNIYSDRRTVTFDGGTATTTVILNNVFTITDQDFDISRFTVQHNVEDRTAGSANFQMATSVALTITQDGNDQILNITVKGAEFISSLLPENPWQLINGDRTLHLFVTAL
jgi:hypothetical protein